MEWKGEGREGRGEGGKEREKGREGPMKSVKPRARKVASLPLKIRAGSNGHYERHLFLYIRILIVKAIALSCRQIINKYYRSVRVNTFTASQSFTAMPAAVRLQQQLIPHTTPQHRPFHSST